MVRTVGLEPTIDRQFGWRALPFRHVRKDWWGYRDSNPEITAFKAVA